MTSNERPGIIVSSAPPIPDPLSKSQRFLGAGRRGQTAGPTPQEETTSAAPASDVQEQGPAANPPEHAEAPEAVGANMCPSVGSAATTESRGLLGGMRQRFSRQPASQGGESVPEERVNSKPSMMETVKARFSRNNTASEEPSGGDDGQMTLESPATAKPSMMESMKQRFSRNPGGMEPESGQAQGQAQASEAPVITPKPSMLESMKQRLGRNTNDLPRADEEPSQEGPVRQGPISAITQRLKGRGADGQADAQQLSDAPRQPGQEASPPPLRTDQMKIADPEVIKMGWMHKRSRTIRAWRNRYVVLTKGTLLTFKEPPTTSVAMAYHTATERITIDSSLIVRPAQVAEVGPGVSVWCVQRPGTDRFPFFFRVTDNREAAAWLEAVANAVRARTDLDL